MRDIKFRVWVEAPDGERAMYYPRLVSFGGGQLSWAALSDDTTIKDDGWYTKREVMQYTGLKDKNGKEIYEGDIVRFKAGDTLVWVVRHGWSDDGEYGWHWEFEGKPRSAIREVDRIKERCEVVGNIYEHEHLLETKEPK